MPRCKSLNGIATCKDQFIPFDIFAVAWRLTAPNSMTFALYTIRISNKETFKLFVTDDANVHIPLRAKLRATAAG